MNKGMEFEPLRASARSLICSFVMYTHIYIKLGLFEESFIAMQCFICGPFIIYPLDVRLFSHYLLVYYTLVCLYVYMFTLLPGQLFFFPVAFLIHAYVRI